MTKIVADKKRKDVRVFGDGRINAGVYNTKGKQRVYHEVVSRQMGGIIAIGNSPSTYSRSTVTWFMIRAACLPCPG